MAERDVDIDQPPESDVRQEWLEQFSVADQLRIDGLDEETRAAVERYARSLIADAFDGDDDDDEDFEEDDDDFYSPT